jgi:hypothetical protein
VSSSTPNGIYGLNKIILVNVAFDATQTVTGQPTFALNSGGMAVYTGGSGMNTLTFTYTIGAGDASSGLDESSSSALALSGGTINGPGAVASALGVPAPGSSGSLGSNSSLVVDTVAPVVQKFLLLFGSRSYNIMGSSRFDFPWMITGIQAVFSKPITAGDATSLTGLAATGFSGLGTNTLTWTLSPIMVGSFSSGLQGQGLDGLTDVAGNYLSAGAGYAQAFKVLYGDFNADGVVNAADMTLVYAATAAPYNVFADVNGDGVVDVKDVTAVRSRLGTTVH